MSLINIEKNKKPDNVADNPGLLPYGSNIGAPSISPDNVENWKVSRLENLNNHFKTKYNELKNEFDSFMEEFYWNELIYRTKFNFEPIVGHIYHLYYDKNENPFLSIIGPNEWDQKYIGSFKLNSDNRWIKI